MKIDFKLCVLVACAFMIGAGVNNFAMSDVPANYKVGIVDIPVVVSKSAQVEALKKEQIKKAEEFKKFVDSARADIEKQKTDELKKSVAQKYEKEITAKQTQNAKDYTKKLADIDKKISSVINAKAKERGYDLILAKGAVLYGGEDITDVISKDLK